MSDWTARVTLALLLLLCASFCLTQLSEADFHWHLLTGERILQERRVPHVDSFTYTSAGRPWTDLHWLFQVLTALTYDAAGLAGIELMKIGCLVAAFSLVLLAARRSGVTFALVAPGALLALVAAQERFTLRPEVLSFLFLAALLFLLEEGRRRPGLLLILPAIFALWANCHALYVVGLGVLLGVAAGESLAWLRASGRDGSAGRDAPPARLLLWSAVASIVATLLTPYGLAGWTLPWKLLFERIAGENVYARNIAEFQAPFGGYAPTTSIAAFGLLALLVIVATIVGRRETRPSDLLVWVPLFGLALLARRNMPLFALASVPACARALDAAVRRIRRSSGATGGGRVWAPRIAGLVVPAVALVLLSDVWSNRFFARDSTQRYFGRGLAAGFYPEGAAAFIQKDNPAGEVLHDMTMGGYLAWRWYPSRRIFIDGRLEVHDEKLFAAFLGMEGDPALFETLARTYGVDTVLWSHRHSPEAAPLLRYLSGGHGWRLVFVDLAASVFARAKPGGAVPSIDPDDPELGRAILAQVRSAEAGSERLDPAPHWVRRLLPRRDVPVAEVNAAVFFGVVDGVRVAEMLFREALRVAPDNAAIHYDLGLVLERAGRPQEARGELEASLRNDASFSSAREALALNLLKAGDANRALEEWAIAERGSSLAMASLVARGSLLAGRGRVDEAIEDYRSAVA
ncbi:MAG TPA: tetratricopeptide repeat protein, partial [Candidatus Polarisedimenticolia bacterium]|nr:tetratricopeptide repeat protein [Candidatus Polarisedimenticolia bacterium]